MSQLPAKDTRGFFMLPQAPEQSGYGYYTYGTPANGAGQYAHPKLLSLIAMIEHRWQEVDNRKIGIGNISLAGGGTFAPHEGHQSGLDVDVRPLRKDGQESPVTWADPQYDHDATAKLIAMFFESGGIDVIFFNDLTIPRVRSRVHHDNHFHVTMKS